MIAFLLQRDATYLPVVGRLKSFFDSNDDGASGGLSS